jgi:hypothetical protein
MTSEASMSGLMTEDCSPSMTSEASISGLKIAHYNHSSPAGILLPFQNHKKRKTFQGGRIYIYIHVHQIALVQVLQIIFFVCLFLSFFVCLFGFSVAQAGSPFGVSRSLNLDCLSNIL